MSVLRRGGNVDRLVDLKYRRNDSKRDRYVEQEWDDQWGWTKPLL
ncbi:MAG: hypothetical protein ACI9TF_000798 [Paracrocinitomix sp.]|jgi:hypothetical protein